MKFGCESCGAQYMIADEKVGKAGVKVRCKKCSHVIVVRPAANAETDQATVVMDNPLAGLEPAEAPAFEDAGADMEIGAAFDSIFGESSAGSSALQNEEPKDPFSAAVDSAFDAALGSMSKSAAQAADDHQSTRVFTSADMRLVASEREHAAEPAFGGGSFYPESRAEPEPEEEPAGEWYVAIDDDQIGPLTVEQVQGHWESGDLSPDSLVWRQGMADWEPLSSVDELKHLIAPTPSLPQRQDRSEEQHLPWSDSSAGGSADDDDSEDEVVWKPAAASLLASLAAEEMSALEKESEEGDSLAGPSADPVAEIAAAASSPMAALGLDLPPPPPPPAPEPDPRDLAVPQSSGPEYGVEQRVPTPTPFAPPVSPAFQMPQAPAHAASPHAGPQYDAFAQPPAGYSGYAPHAQSGMGVGGFGPGPVTAAPPPPPGLSKRMLLAIIGGGGAGLSAALVFLILIVTGVIGGEKSDALALDPRPLDPAQETPSAPEQKADEPEPAKADSKSEPAASEDTKAAEPEEPAQAKQAVAEAAPAAPAPRPAAARTTAPARQQAARQAPPQRAATPPPAPRETTPPPRQQTRRSGGDEEDLEAALFGSGGGGRRSQPAQQTREEPAAGARGYIPPAAGARDRDLPREVSRGDIMQVVSSKRNDLRGCVNRQRAAEPGASGTVVMAWRIQPDGNPTGIRSKSEEHRGSVMTQCLTQVIGTMRFPRYGGPPMAEIEFPFSF